MPSGLIALTSDVEITLGVAAFFALLALLVFLRLLFRKEPPSWRVLRFGIYVERVPSNKEEDRGSYQE